MQKGQFFVLDGVDGSGKGEQIKLLKEKLPQLYPDREFVFTREPGGSPYAEQMRVLMLNNIYAKDASGEVMIQLFGAARFDHLGKIVFPALNAGKVVISDRFDGSTYAYQIMAQQGGYLAQKFFRLQRRLICEMLPSWSTIILDVDTAIAMSRRGGRTGQESTHFDEREAAFHEAVRRGFRSYVREYLSPDMAIVDAGRTIEEVHQDILALFRDKLG